jgi:hypothetical protein
MERGKNKPEHKIHANPTNPRKPTREQQDRFNAYLKDHKIEYIQGNKGV